VDGKIEVHIFKYADNYNIKDQRRNELTSSTIKTKPKHHVIWAGGADKQPRQALSGLISYLQQLLWLPFMSSTCETKKSWNFFSIFINQPTPLKTNQNHNQS